MAKIIAITNGIFFDNGMYLGDYHEQNCCESHYLAWGEADYSGEGLEIDLSEESIKNEKFFRRIDGYGIEILAINGWGIKIPGYGSNNGYYSSDINLYLNDKDGNVIQEYDISSCQDCLDYY